MNEFEIWFANLAGGNRPHPWQRALGEDGELRDRLIRIPTGFGKTAGTVLAWLWNRVKQNDDRWPRRLAFCLPMRVLVEQTESEVRKWLEKAGVLWDGTSDHAGKVGVHVLMGGADSGEWHLHPEQPAILIGTQDMLLSRALNRGYASPRARWPMEFGLLNHDCLWVLDEVQLMDVGLATSAQLQAFRDEDTATGKMLRPCHSWWMSATLQAAWLGKSPETKERAESLHHERVCIPVEARTGDLWECIRKAPAVGAFLEKFTDAKAIAKRVAALHVEHRANGITLVVMNTVARAMEVADALRKGKAAADIRLIHSRFRPKERRQWAEFLKRDACAPGTDRIIVATQVIEAGVDISARLLVTELAPWPNLVQRFGRAARWAGGPGVIVDATVVVADLGFTKDEKAAPYQADALQASRDALGLISDVAPMDLERFEEAHPELLPKLYPYDPMHLLVRRELDDLFDTALDLSGADVDISRFIRSGDERDVHVFWADVPAGSEPSPEIRAMRDGLCAVQFIKAREWLCGPGKGDALKENGAYKRAWAWAWDWLDGRWRRCTRRDCWPGQTILVAAQCGGYLKEFGWSPDATDSVDPVNAEPTADSRADDAQDDEALSAFAWRTIATHGGDVAAEALKIGSTLTPALAAILHLAGRWHDVGKAHPAFQNSISDVSSDGRQKLKEQTRQDLAKAPKKAWLNVRKLYPMDGGRRPGFRHELASTLALFAVLRRHRCDHPALLGPWRELLEKAGRPALMEVPTVTAPNPLEQEILALSAEDFDLLAFLVCSHHGKVRVSWHACPADQVSGDRCLRIRGIRDQDSLPAVPLIDAQGGIHDLPKTVLDLAPAAAGLDRRFGRGWTERVLGLLAQHGPFRLAWLESCLRAADIRGSRIAVVDSRVEIIS